MSHLPFDVVIPDSVWRRALLAYAVLLGMFVLMIALDLSMDTVRALPHVFAADAPERSQMTQGQLVGFYLGYGVLPLVAMVLLAVVAGVIAWGLKGDEDGVILFILLVWSGMSWSVIFLFPTSRAMHGALGLEWDYVQPPYVNVDNVLAVGFLLLFPCLLRLSVLFPERAIGAPADLDSHARRLREWSLGLKIPIAVGAILAAGLGIGTVIPSAAAAGVWAAIGIFLGR